MDDQEGIQNMYPPTRQARAGKIQIDCYITMDDQEHNSQFVSYLSLLVLLEDTYSVYLPGHPLLYNSQFVSYLPLLVMLEDTYSVYLPGLIEPNRLRIVKYFDPYVVFDIMRQESVITMDDQERIQNMYPPTRRARAGKIQIDCYITMDDQEGIQNMYPPT
jgi:hypothetical protein